MNIKVTLVSYAQSCYIHISVKLICCICEWHGLSLAIMKSCSSGRIW